MSQVEAQALCAELASARLEIAALQAELVRIRVVQEDLLYTVVHDLRAPLRHVTSFVQMVREDLQDSGIALAPQIYAGLDRVTDAARHQGRLIDALLDLSRIGRAQLQINDVALGALVAELLPALQAGAASRSVQWRIADPLPTVRVDAALLRGVLQHLLDNALKFTGTRAQALVSLRARAMPDGGCEIEISDNGVGFASHLQDKLFRPFARLHGVAEFAGLGMGLALASAAARRLGGSIELRAETDQGCTAFVRLPAP